MAKVPELVWLVVALGFIVAPGLLQQEKSTKDVTLKKKKV